MSGGVKLSRLRTAIDTLEMSPQNSFGELHLWRLVRHKAVRELFYCLMPFDRVLSVHPIFEDEQSNGSDKKFIESKIKKQLVEQRNGLTSRSIKSLNLPHLNKKKYHKNNRKIKA